MQILSTIMRTGHIKQSCTSSFSPAVHPWLYCLVLGCTVLEWRWAFILIVLVQCEIAHYKSPVLLFFFVFGAMVTTVNTGSTDSAINGKLPSNLASGVASIVACGNIAIGNGSKPTPPTRDDIERANDCDSIQTSDSTATENKSKFPSTNNINKIANGSQSTPMQTIIQRANDESKRTPFCNITARANECESFPVCGTIVRATGSKEILSNNNGATSSVTSTFTSILSATIECPSINLAKSLKTYKERQYHNGISGKNDAMIIFRFDTKLFSKICDEKSPAYDKNINLNALLNELFKPGEKCLSQDLLQVAVNEVAKAHGWSAKMKQQYIQCNRYGKNETTRIYANGNLLADCSWRITLKALVKHRTRAQGSARFSYTNLRSKPIEIVNATCEHSGQCQPGRQNRAACLQRAGKYVKYYLPENALFILCNFMEHGGKLASSTIKRVLSPVWPKAKNVTKSDVYNTRLKVLR